jgi:glyoxylase-like metal-dependent hydrolase (beta-lactamase superfamily II)
MRDPIQCFRWTSYLYGNKFPLSVQAYFVDGLLIDTGPGKLKAQVLESLRILPIEQIFLTHHHEDHTGNLALIHQAHPDVPMYAHPTCVDILKDPPKVSFAEYLTWGKHTAVQDIQPVGETLSTFKYAFTPIYTPGHAVDHLALYEPNEGWLFSGDIYVHPYITYFVANECMATQMTSLKKLIALDFDRLLCSHSRDQLHGKKLLQQKLQFFQTFSGKVLHWHQQGYPPKQIMRKMQLKERWMIKILSGGWLSALNMVKSVIRAERLGLWD